MKKIALTFVAVMMMTISYAETENRNEVANVQETDFHIKKVRSARCRLQPRPPPISAAAAAD